MREKGGIRAGWIGEWGKGERSGMGWMDGGVERQIEEGAWRDGWGSEVRKREWGWAGWMGE